MELSDRKLLMQIRLHSGRGENMEVRDLIQKRLQNMAHYETVMELQKLTSEKKYDIVLEKLMLLRELYPHDEELAKVEGECLLLSCVE